MTQKRTLLTSTLLVGLVTLVMLAISIAGVVRTVAFYAEWTTYAAQADRVEGQVLNLYTNFWLRNYFITYHYEDIEGEAGAESTAYTREEQVPRRIYNSVAEGDSITLLYDREQPADLRIKDNNRELLRFSLTTAGWVVATLIAIVNFIRVIRAERALQEYNKERPLASESENNV